jgi:serine protease Do
MKKINIRNLALTIILILSIVLGTGCDLIFETETSQPSSPETTENVTSIDSDWSIPATESEAQILPSIADVVALVKPSVVAINTEVVTIDIFNRSFTQEGAGSGWIISEDGIIVTNNHVVEGAKNITVILDDGRTFSVNTNTVATDPLTDLAVLKINAENLPAATVGNSRNLRIGDWVVAIGNSLGERISATNGIVSALGVSLQVSSDQTLYNLVQTDAAINPGNSGGPLVNMAGEVIGITSAKIAEVGVEGMGYAISTQEAAPVIEQLINNGYVVRPWLGVSFWPVDEYVIQTYNLSVDKGAFIVYVADGSPADKAGLQPIDVVAGFAGQDIDTVDDLIQAIRSAQVGQTVEIIYWRGESKNTTQATLIESPPPS